MTRKRAKKLLMRYTLSRNAAGVVLEKKPDGLTNAEVVNSFRDNYIAHLANLLAEFNIAEKTGQLARCRRACSL